MGAFANLVGAHPGRPPRLILLLGGFFVLTVGGLVIRGITALFGRDVVSGLKDLADFGLQVPRLAIAIGVIATERWVRAPQEAARPREKGKLRRMSTMVERLRDAQNAHDAEQMAALFADDYASSQPVHPGRAFTGRAQVPENWTSVFEGVPDFVSRLLSSSIDGDKAWGEWDWRGHHVDGSPFLMRGVTILILRDGLIAEGRLYVEPVEDAGEDIDSAVRELYKPPSADESGSSAG